MAMPPAAAAPDRNEVGSVQNTGNAPNTPNAATDSATIFIVGSDRKVLAVIPNAATSKANAAWNLRSCFWSDRRPQ